MYLNTHDWDYFETLESPTSAQNDSPEHYEEQTSAIKSEPFIDSPDQRIQGTSATVFSVNAQRFWLRFSTESQFCCGTSCHAFGKCWTSTYNKSANTAKTKLSTTNTAKTKLSTTKQLRGVPQIFPMRLNPLTLLIFWSHLLSSGISCAKPFQRVQRCYFNSENKTTCVCAAQNAECCQQIP